MQFYYVRTFLETNRQLQACKCTDSTSSQNLYCMIIHCI